jgi:hypothetical protein
MDRRIIAQLFDSIDYISSFNRLTKSENSDDSALSLIQKQDQPAHKLVVLVVATNK